MSADELPADPSAAMAWIEGCSASMSWDLEDLAEIDLDGFAAWLRRRLSALLGEPRSEFIEVGDGSVIELREEGPPVSG